MSALADMSRSHLECRVSKQHVQIGELRLLLKQSNERIKNLGVEYRKLQAMIRCLKKR